MSRRGNCWDNAIAESFFHTLKVELIHENKYKTREVAKQSIFQYIEIYYNQQRLHSAIDYRTPNEVEYACWNWEVGVRWNAVRLHLILLQK